MSSAGERARTGAGGVSPPWFRYRVCTGGRQHTVGSLPRLCESVLANAPAEPRRAHARCSRACARRSCANVCRIVLAWAIPTPRRAHARRSRACAGRSCANVFRIVPAWAIP